MDTTEAQRCLVGPGEMAKILGVTTRTLKKYVAEKKIPSYKLGSAQNSPRKFDVDAVLARFLDE